MDRYRHEYKYRINSFQESFLMIRTAGIMNRDPYADENGRYTVRSLYFDDISDSCFYENENGTDPRSKFRIRYYNNDCSRLSLERKSKCRGMTYKESCLLDLEDYHKIVNGDFLGVNCRNSIERKLILDMQIRNLVPKVIVTYNRVPYVYGAGNVRITFDQDISSSSDIGRFLSGKYEKRMVLPVGESILEVKWDELLPFHIKEVMSDYTLQWSSFSKYYMCRILSI